MKKFFTSIPLQQKNNLKLCVYNANDNSKLTYGETRFPIIPVINGYTDKEDEILIIAICNEEMEQICNCLEQEVQKLSDNIGFKFKIEYVIVPIAQDVVTQIANFQNLIDFVDDNDTIYADLTFGTKLQSMTLKMAMGYAKSIKINSYIDCVVYGQVNYELTPWEYNIYDITAIFKMEDIIQVLAENKVANPEKIINQIISM